MSSGESPLQDEPPRDAAVHAQWLQVLLRIEDDMQRENAVFAAGAVPAQFGAGNKAAG